MDLTGKLTIQLKSGKIENITISKIKNSTVKEMINKISSLKEKLEKDKQTYIIGLVMVVERTPSQQMFFGLENEYDNQIVFAKDMYTLQIMLRNPNLIQAHKNFFK